MASLAQHPVFSLGGDLPSDSETAALRASAQKYRRPVMPYDECIATICVVLLRKPTFDIFEWAAFAEEVRYIMKRDYDLDYSITKVFHLLDLLKQTVAEGL